MRLCVSVCKGYVVDSHVHNTICVAECVCVWGGYIKTNNNFALKIEYKQHNASEACQCADVE